MLGCLLPHHQDCVPHCGRRLWVGLSQVPQLRVAVLLHRGHSLEPWCPSSRVSGRQRTGAQKTLESRGYPSCKSGSLQQAPELAQPSTGVSRSEQNRLEFLSHWAKTPVSSPTCPSHKPLCCGPVWSKPIPGSRHSEYAKPGHWPVRLVSQPLACLSLSVARLEKQQDSHFRRKPYPQNYTPKVPQNS